jgi:two-component system response regulator HydG
MMEYEWPGTVRELENFVERAMILYRGSPAINFDPPAAVSLRSEQALLGIGREQHWTIDRLEREYILSVLEKTGGNQTRAASILGIDRRTLYRKLKRYGMSDGGE